MSYASVANLRMYCSLAIVLVFLLVGPFGRAQSKESSAPSARVPQHPRSPLESQDLIPTVIVAEGSCEKACSEKKAFDPSFKRIPPSVKNVRLEILKTGQRSRNAKLTVEFQADRRLKEIVTIRVGEQSASLKRLSGSTYAGLVALDVDALEKELERSSALAREEKTVPVFANRLLVAKEQVPKLSFDRTRILAELNPALLHNLLSNPTNIDPSRELMVTDTNIVDDPARTFNPCSGAGVPMGIWTFGHLMSEMANQPTTGVDPSDFVLGWLNTYSVPQTVNGWPVAARNIQAFINAWPKLANGKLDLSKAPFVLLAIVNRVDLRENFVYGGGGNAGEARFVFAAVNPSASCSPMQFTVIFEYGINKSSCGQLHAWAQAWHNLASQPLGSPAYNVLLQSITDQFSLAGANPSKPNGSALNQLRTNEIVFGGPWELREFHIVTPGQLQQVVVKQTADSSVNNKPVVKDYINANEASLVASTNVVPLQFPGTTHFLGGSSIDQLDFWNGPATINNNDARQKFSLNACNACHGGETKTTFKQIEPRSPGTPAKLAAFLTGETIPDPAVPATQRTYNDLLRRQGDLDGLLNSGCLSLGFLKGLTFKPLVMTH